MARTTCPSCGVLSRGRHCPECGPAGSGGGGAPGRSLVLLVVLVLAGLAGVGGAQLTHALFTDTKTITGNTLSTATLMPPLTAPVVTANPGSLVLTWAPSTYADGYYIYRAAAADGPWDDPPTNVMGQASATWTDTTPPAGTNWYKMTAHRNNWVSAETAASQGIRGPVTVVNDYTWVPANPGPLQSFMFTVPAGVSSVNILAKGGPDSSMAYSGGIAGGDMLVDVGRVLNIRLKDDYTQRSVSAEVWAPYSSDPGSTAWVVKASGGAGYGDYDGNAYANSLWLNPRTASAGGWWGQATIRITYTMP